MYRTRLGRLASSITLAAAALLAPPSHAGAVSVGYTGHAGDRLTASLQVADLALFEAGDFTFSFDPGILSLQRVDAGSLTSSFQILPGPAVQQATGTLADVIVSLITGAGPVAGDGTLFTAVFILMRDTASNPATLGLNFDELEFGFSLAEAGLVVNTDTTTHAVPEADGGALALAGLLALFAASGRTVRAARRN